MVAARIVARQVISPDGTGPETCIAVEAENEVAIFLGSDAYRRAMDYARAHYAPLEFVMHADPGHIGLTMGTA